MARMATEDSARGLQVMVVEVRGELEVAWAAKEALCMKRKVLYERMSEVARATHSALSRLRAEAPPVPNSLEALA